MGRYLLNALHWARPSSGRFFFTGLLHKPCYFPRHVQLGRRYFTASRIAKSMLDGDSTIYALSTAPGRAAIAVVRASGPACVQIYKALCPKAPLPRPRVAALRVLYDPTQEPSSNSVVDAGALVLYFPGPNTVTGEDVLELHLHGGPAIVKSVLTAIARSSRGQKGEESLIRYAEPGEFTRRAFMNDRLDLPQIEALGHTLSADTEQQRRLAVRGSSHALSERYELWRRQLLYARGELEALIDFSEDQHFDESSDELVASVATQVRSLQWQINLHIRNASKGELLRNGIKVALLGAPNAGKSSLLNLVVGKEAAIVSTEEGTTRDIVDVGVDIGGWYCKLGDMAGIRSESGGLVTEGSIGAVEKEGIRRAKARALESDVVLVILSLEKYTDDGGASYKLSVEQEVLDAAQDCVQAGKSLLVVINKCDRLAPLDRVRAGQPPSDLTAAPVRALLATVPEDRIVPISCREAQEGSSSPGQEMDPGNIQGLLKSLISTFEQIASPLGIDGDEDGQYDINYWEDSLGVTHRQSSNLQRCLQHLDDFLTQTVRPDSNLQTKPENLQLPHDDASHDGIETDVDIVTAAEHLRFAADALGMITGKGDSGDVDDVLGVVFEKFCVGK